MPTPFNWWGALDQPPGEFDAAAQDPQTSPTQSYDASASGPLDAMPINILSADRSPASMKKKAKAKSAPAPMPAPMATPSPMPSPSPTPEAAVAAMQAGGLAPMLANYQLQNRGGAASNKVGSIIKDEAQATQDQKRTAMKSTMWSPDQMKIMQKVAMGITPGQATDPNGSPVYAKVPVRDQQGRPIIDKQGNPVMMDDPDQPLYDDSHDVTDPNHPVQQQLAGLKGLEGMNQAMVEKAPVQTDYSPLLKLIDTYTGSNLTQGYNPRQVQPLLEKAMQHAMDLQKRRQDISKDAIDGIKSMKSGSIQDMYYQKLLEQQDNGINNKPVGGGRGNPNTDYYKWLNFSQKQLKDYDEGLKMGGQLIEELKAGNPIDDNRISIIRAAMDAHGRPNMAEISREGDPALKARISNAWERVSTGKMTEHNRAEYVDSLNTVVQYLGRHRGDMIERSKEIGKQTGLSGSQIGANFSHGYEVPDRGVGVKAAAAPAGPPADPSAFKSAWEAEKAKRAKAASGGQ